MMSAPLKNSAVATTAVTDVGLSTVNATDINVEQEIAEYVTATQDGNKKIISKMSEVSTSEAQSAEIKDACRQPNGAAAEGITQNEEKTELQQSTAEDSASIQVEHPVLPEGVSSSKKVANIRRNKSTDAEHKTGNAPFHVLMLPPSEQPQIPPEKPRVLLTNWKLRRDYLSQRYRAYHTEATSSTDTDSAENKKEGQSLLKSVGPPSLWSGITPLERALVECCEIPPFLEDEEREGTEPSLSSPQGGALARGYEVRFAGLVAKHCHNVESRVLALAILERTLEQDQEEAMEAEREELQPTASTEDESTNGDDEEVDDDWDPEEEESNRRGKHPRKKGRGRPRKRRKNILNEVPECLSSPGSPLKSSTGTEGHKKEDVDMDIQPDRMSVFVSAGGLKLLGSWLVDAMTPVLIPSLKPAVDCREAHSKTLPTKRCKPSLYGPILLPLLLLLKDIPFDRDLVVESKINKHIRRLSKQVDGLIDKYKKENIGKSKDSLESYMDPGAGVGGLVVVQVQKALNRLKQTWEDHAKIMQIPQEHVTQDPFENIKQKLRERLNDLKSMEEGDVSKPGWLRKYEVAQEDRVKKRRGVPVKPAVEPKQSNTEQLAQKEREAERAALKNKLKAAEEERKAHLERLKNQINKRISSESSKGAQEASGLDPAVHPPKKKETKTVKWKDGISSDKIRKREILEQVYILHQSAEDAPEGEVLNKQEEGKTSKRHKDDEEITGTNDDLGLFEFDETLLL